MTINSDVDNHDMGDGVPLTCSMMIRIDFDDGHGNNSDNEVN